MILLDTHVFVWLNVDKFRTPNHILQALADEEAAGLSAISLWEIAMLVQYGRLSLPGESLLSRFHAAVEAKDLQLLPLTPQIAARSGTLQMHGDPADRLIAAKAMELGCRLATVDERLLNLPGCKR